LDMGQRVTKGVGDTAVIASAAKQTAEAVEAEVNRFMMTGGGGKLSALDGRLGSCEAYVGAAQSDYNILASKLIDIMDGKVPLPPQPPPAGMVTQDSLNTAMKEIRGQLARLQQSIHGGGITCGGKTFDSYASVLLLVKQSFPRMLVYECFFDPISLLCQTTDNVVYKDEVQQTEIHAEKTKRSPAQSSMLHSYQTQVPPAFAGRRDLDTGDAKSFGAMKTHNEWDPGDGNGGLFNRIFRDMDTVVESLHGMMDGCLGEHAEALSFCRDLLEKTLTFLNALCTEISTFYRYLLTSTYGVGVAYSAKAEASCWKVSLTMVKTWLEEMWKVRAPAKHAYATLTDVDEINATYLYATIRAHGVMAEFRKYNFRRHPRVYPGMVQHIFNTYVTKDDIASSNTSCSRLTQRCQQLETTVDNLKKLQDNQASTIGDLKRQVAAFRAKGGKLHKEAE
jgi:hypothetical protein